MSTSDFLSAEKRAELKTEKERWKMFLARAEKASFFSVAIFGEHNNGKSMLCNALIKDWDNKTFPVGDVRMTEDVQEILDATSGVTFVGTPGLGSSWAEDKDKVREVWSSANLLVFTHSMRGGELNEDEQAILRELQSVVPDIEKRLFVACSKFPGIDSKTMKGKLRTIKEQIATIFREPVPAVLMDCDMYKKGYADKHEKTIHDSKVEILVQWINENRHMPVPQAETLDADRERYSRAAKSVLKSLKKVLKSIHMDKQAYEDRLKQCWQDRKDSIASAWGNCAEYQK